MFMPLYTIPMLTWPATAKSKNANAKHVPETKKKSALQDTLYLVQDRRRLRAGKVVIRGHRVDRNRLNSISLKLCPGEINSHVFWRPEFTRYEQIISQDSQGNER
jgi:hypothetical protein